MIKLRRTLGCRAVVGLGARGAGKSGVAWLNIRAYNQAGWEPSK